jgi:DNA-binding HxlR family transcriptional regulator
MNPKTILSNELRKLVETRLKDNLNGIEATLQQVFQTQPLELEDLKETMKALEQSFNMLSQKWNLQILYTLFLRKNAGFGELKKILGINSRTLSDKLKSLSKSGYVGRTVEQGPPLRVRYTLTTKGNNTILLALPFLYYSSGNLA